MTSERLPPQAHAALLESSCVSKRRMLGVDEGRVRMKPQRGTLTSTQQAKRKLVVHFLGGRSYHLTGAKSYNVYGRSAIGSGRIFYTLFTMSFGEIYLTRPPKAVGQFPRKRM